MPTLKRPPKVDLERLFFNALGEGLLLGMNLHPARRCHAISCYLRGFVPLRGCRTDRQGVAVGLIHPDPARGPSDGKPRALIELERDRGKVPRGASYKVGTQPSRG